jgi:hypothetical protein
MRACKTLILTWVVHEQGMSAGGCGGAGEEERIRRDERARHRQLKSIGVDESSGAQQPGQVARCEHCHAALVVRHHAAWCGGEQREHAVGAGRKGQHGSLRSATGRSPRVACVGGAAKSADTRGRPPESRLRHFAVSKTAR